MRNAERTVVDEMPPGAHEPAARPGANQNGDVIEQDTSGRLTNKSRKLEERRPGGRSIRPFAISRVWCNRGTASALRHGRTEMSDIPGDRAQRVLMIHVNVTEALHLASLSVLDQRTVRAAEITEAALSSWLHALGSHFQDLLLGGKPRQSVAGHVHELAVRGVPHLRDFQTLGAELLVVFPRVRRIPAEMPHRGLRPGQLCLGWRVDLGEQQIDVPGLDRLVSVESCLRG